MRQATVALIVSGPKLIETLSDDREIAIFELALAETNPNPFGILKEHRDRLAKEDEDFSDYVEDLLCQPFLNPEIREHGLQWMKSKIRIEQYEKAENEALKVITDFAYKLFSENPEKTDFVLSGPSAHVRVKVFAVDPALLESIAA